MLNYWLVISDEKNGLLKFGQITKGRKLSLKKNPVIHLHGRLICFRGRVFEGHVLLFIGYQSSFDWVNNRNEGEYARKPDSSDAEVMLFTHPKPTLGTEYTQQIRNRVKTF